MWLNEYLIYVCFCHRLASIVNIIECIQAEARLEPIQVVLRGSQRPGHNILVTTPVARAHNHAVVAPPQLPTAASSAAATLGVRKGHDAVRSLNITQRQIFTQYEMRC